MTTILPMRPTFAGILKSEDDLRTVLSLPNVIVQPKLGGDRVVLHKEESELKAFNRKGEPYKFSFNTHPWMAIPRGTILDGEVFGGEFHPFDCLQFNGASLMEEKAIVRIGWAAEFCAFACVQFMFRAASFEWLRAAMAENRGKGQRMQWEGVVVKDANSTYVPLSNYRHESYTWRKYKWM